MKIVKYTLAILTPIAIGFAIWIHTQPEQFTVQRSATIEAPVPQVFALVADFQQWQKWSPWFKRDPAMKRTVSETSSGLGAKQEWESDTQGSGFQTTETFEENRLIRHKLVFVKPFEGTSEDEFAFEPIGDTQTRVTWTMFGQNKGFMEKLFFALFDLPSAIGKDFEEGLSLLSEAAKAQ